MNGWWKFHRAMFSHPVCQLPHTQRWVWITILNTANITTKEWFDGKERIEIEAGSFITSQQHLADLAGVTRQVIRDSINALQKIGSIRTKIRTKRHTQITVVNWPLYQCDLEKENQDENTKRTSKEPSENQVGTITEEGKKERRKRKIPEPSPRALPESAPWPSPLALFLKYNREATDNCPAITSVSPGRMKKAQEYLTMFPDESWWTRTFRQYHLSRFLNGTEERTNGHKGFQPDFDWLLSKGKTDGIENCVKVHDGRYSDAQG